MTHTVSASQGEAVSDETLTAADRSPRPQDTTRAKKGTPIGAMNRRHQALELRITGLSFRRIASALGVSLNQAYKDVETALAEMPTQSGQRLEQTRRLELARLDADVDDEIVTSPPAEWRAGRGVLDESQRAQPLREKSTRFGSTTEEPPQPRAQLFLRQLPLTHTSVAYRVDQRQKLVERRVLPGGFRRGFVQWLEGGAAYLAVRIWPYRPEVAVVRDLITQRRSSVRSRHAARGLTAPHRKRVLDAMDQELFDRLQERSARLAVDQAGSFQTLRLPGFVISAEVIFGMLDQPLT